MGALAFALAVLLLCAGIAYASWRSADELVHPARRPIATTPASVGLAYENVTLRSDAGALSAWWIPAESPKGVVVFLHGYGDNKAQAVPLARALYEANYTLLALDLRAHGESDGDFTTVGMDEVRDVEAAIAYARVRDPVSSERLALFGWSMGAATAINAAARAPEVDAVVADSAFATLENIASNSIQHFTDLPKYPFGPLSVVFAGWMVDRDVGDNAPLRALADVRAPVLVIQGAEDTIALPDEDGRALAAAAPAGSELWVVEGAAHVSAHGVARDEYEGRVTAFLDAVLSSGAHAG